MKELKIVTVAPTLLCDYKPRHIRAVCGGKRMQCAIVVILCYCLFILSKKLLFWSRDLCLHAILLLLSNFHTHRLKWRQDITERRFSIWRLSAILNLRKLLLWSRYLYLHVILHLRSKFHILFLLVLESKECSFAVRRSITAQTHDT